MNRISFSFFTSGHRWHFEHLVLDTLNVVCTMILRNLLAVLAGTSVLNGRLRKSIILSICDIPHGFMRSFQFRSISIWRQPLAMDVLIRNFFLVTRFVLAWEWSHRKHAFNCYSLFRLQITNTNGCKYKGAWHKYGWIFISHTLRLVLSVQNMLLQWGKMRYRRSPPLLNNTT